MVGFAYLRMDTTPYAKFEIYLVVKKDNEYKFIKFKKFDVGLFSVKEMEEDLLEKGYHPLPYYFRKAPKRQRQVPTVAQGLRRYNRQAS